MEEYKAKKEKRRDISSTVDSAGAKNTIRSPSRCTDILNHVTASDSQWLKSTEQGKGRQKRKGMGEAGDVSSFSMTGKTGAHL